MPQPLDCDVHGFAIDVDPPPRPWGQEQPGAWRELLAKVARPKLVHRKFTAASEGGTDMTQVSRVESDPFLGDMKCLNGRQAILLRSKKTASRASNGYVTVSLWCP